ncbi:xaa-Pro aminopeptidase ApepP-like [Uranotaenia lowii]|uniref:xaa-Pro aminopeptidase ApepP-like n=1 Tax=Uranotaenia lowii TaxID=190385 RepID=UPI0024789DD5|nr:xaa-Pro aminopeptidase ApepP-like [Uranotaenia lowii]XP_055587082.1 xaa-Pro aminopeptidase ApepP-like [Uranotaenia lowii]XP_055587083.1 xaa-Pro aminopeptidase ApepP-like [Uranotaenia lowii]XP_055587084.1 xaa-Pro aminopeptidase ApepP-like [Uranotaenia lowii]
MGKAKKLLIGASALLIIMVGCGVAFGRTLSGDDDLMFDDTPKTMDRILQEIRSHMQDYSIDAYIVPSVDAHNTEYISQHDRRLRYVTNFTGSAGTAIITLDKAALWTDSRYHLQAEAQLDGDHWTLMKQGVAGVPTQDQWLLDNLPGVAQVGADPFLITSTEFDRLAKVLIGGGKRLITLERNLVDIVWNNRPAQTAGPLLLLDIKFSGKRASEKVADLRKELETRKAAAIVINGLDEIAWLLNMRGSDIRYNPVFFAYVIVSRSEILLFTNPERINSSVQEHFRSEGITVNVREYNDILKGIEKFVDEGDRLIVASSCSQAIYAHIPVDQRIQVYSIVASKKAVKNSVEAEGMRKAHIRDGAALVRYLHWLEKNVDSNNVTELSGAAKLREFRSVQENFVDLSFTAISSFGPNGAIVHYSPTEETDTLITRDSIYLIDSGGQYLDGTTDVTRSVHMGTPTSFQKEAFTRVLKGFLSLGSAVFPTKTSGTFFDAMARRALWDVGLDYGHGTGHGIGSFLGVHEYPPSIVSNSASPSNQGLEENMFTSNEPGYYEANQFGIRLEDIVQVVKAEVAHDFGGRGALTFYTNTVAPLQTKLMDLTLLSDHEIELINAYHSRVLREVGPLLLDQGDNDAFMWLRQQTQTIVK